MDDVPVSTNADNADTLQDAYDIINVLTGDIIKLQRQVKELQAAHHGFVAWVKLVIAANILQPLVNS